MPKELNSWSSIHSQKRIWKPSTSPSPLLEHVGGRGEAKNFFWLHLHTPAPDIPCGDFFTISWKGKCKVKIQPNPHAILTSIDIIIHLWRKTITGMITGLIGWCLKVRVIVLLWTLSCGIINFCFLNFFKLSQKNKVDYTYVPILSFH